jgi:hypothetical protein
MVVLVFGFILLVVLLVIRGRVGDLGVSFCTSTASPRGKSSSLGARRA